MLFLQSALRGLLCVAAGASILGCSATGKNPFATLPNECSQHFSSSGAGFLGQSFRTQVMVQSATPNKVFEQLTTRIRQEGFTLTEVNPREGVLQARSKTTSGALTEPLIVGVSEVDQNVSVTFNFSTLAGQYTPEESVHRQFCLLAQDAQRLAFTRQDPAKRASKKREVPPQAATKQKTAGTPAPPKVVETKPDSAPAPAAVDSKVRNRY